MIYCKLALEDKTHVGRLNVPAYLPKDYTIRYGGKVYRILAGQVLEVPGGHVADGLLLTVEEVKRRNSHDQKYLSRNRGGL